MDDTANAETQRSVISSSSLRLPDLMTPDEVAKIASVSKRTVWQWAQDRKLPYYRLGGGRRGPLRFARSDVVAFLQKGRVSPSES